MPNLKFDMLENAMDSLQQALQSILLDNATPSDVKSAILSTAHAAELTLKERLRRFDPTQIFTKPVEAGKADAHTVTVGECVKRLKNLAKVTIDDKDAKTIFHLAETRNHLQHAGVEIAFEEAISQIHNVIAFLTDFLNAELKVDIKDLLDQDDIQRLLEIQEIATALKNAAQDQVDQIESDNAPYKLADRAAWQFEVMLCPECWEKYYVFSPDSRISQCQLCHYEGGFVTCDRCGFQAPAGSMDFKYESGDFILCDSCWGDIQAE